MPPVEAPGLWHLLTAARAYLASCGQICWWLRLRALEQAGVGRGCVSAKQWSWGHQSSAPCSGTSWALLTRVSFLGAWGGWMVVCGAWVSVGADSW